MALWRGRTWLVVLPLNHGFVDIPVDKLAQRLFEVRQLAIGLEGVHRNNDSYVSSLRQLPLFFYRASSTANGGATPFLGTMLLYLLRLHFTGLTEVI